MVNRTADDDARVMQAIAAAKRAAAELGIDYTDAELRQAATRSPKTSYEVILEGLDDPVDTGVVLADLEALPGVHAKIVYPDKRAWISAPEDLPYAALEEAFLKHGITTRLTESSMRRRAASFHDLPGRQLVDVQRGSQSTWDLRRSRREEERDLERAKNAGWLRMRDPVLELRSDEDDNIDVLFTARALITKQRLIVSAVLTVPILLLSYVQGLQFPYWQWVAAALSLPVVLWGAWPFHRAALGGLRRGLSALDAASSVAILMAYAWSLTLMLCTGAGVPGWHSQPSWMQFAALDSGLHEVYFDVACGMTVLLLFGRLRTRATRTDLLDELNALVRRLQGEADVVHRNRRSGKSERRRMRASELNVGDDVFVSAGEYLPADGSVIGGSARLGAAPIGGLGGNSEVKVGAFVYAGSFVDEGRIKVRVERTGHRTRIAAVRRWVKVATQSQTRFAWLATRSASMLVPAVFLLALCNAVTWGLIIRNLNAAFTTTLALLSCVAPVALALSSAMATRYGIESATRRGLLLRDGEAVRTLETIDTVIFNRVGTLADNAMRVESISAERGENAELILRVAGALMIDSDHPVSRAVVRAAREARDAGEGGEFVPHWIEASKTQSLADGSFRGTVVLPAREEGESDQRLEVIAWRPRTMSRLRGKVAAAVAEGGSPIIIRWKGKDRGVITLSDSVKPDSSEAVKRLSEMGMDTMMMSRDTYPVARRFADKLRIDSVLAGIEPGRKQFAVREVRARGANVAVVGDSTVVSSLRVADAGILVGVDGESVDPIGRVDSGVDAVVLRSDMTAIPELFSISRKISRLIDVNIWVAWVYNGLAALLAVVGVLPPMAATVLMLGASQFIEWRSRRARAV